MAQVDFILGIAKKKIDEAKAKLVQAVITAQASHTPASENSYLYDYPISYFNTAFREHPYLYDFGDSTPKYNDYQQKSSHNSFETELTIYEEYTTYGITSFEVDIHNGDPRPRFFGDKYAENGDFYVYHHFLDTETHYPHLSDSLVDLKRISLENPNHEVITFHIDLKDILDADHDLGANDLDNILRENLGHSLYTPNELIIGSGEDTLKEAYNKNGLPQLNELEGKFMIVLTGSNDNLEAYLNESDNPVAFISVKPEYSGGTFQSHPNAIMYNLSMNDIDKVPQISNEGYISRVYHGEGEDDYQAALDAGANHIAVDIDNEDKNNGSSSW